MRICSSSLSEILLNVESYFKNKDVHPVNIDAPSIDSKLFNFEIDPSRKVSSIIQELELALELCSYFSDQNYDYTRYRIFDLIFTMGRDNYRECRREVLCKLVSLAVSLKNSAVLECAALWMKTTQVEHANYLVNSLIEDFCMLKSDGDEELKACLDVSPRFCCVFITAVTSYYSMLTKAELKEKEKENLATNRWPSLKLLEIVQSIMSKDPTVCHATITSMDKLWRTVLKAKRHHPILSLTPHTHVAGWCIKSPLVPTTLVDKTSVTDYVNISEKLQNALLLSLQASKSATKAIRGSDSSMWSKDELHSLVKSLKNLCDEVKDREVYSRMALDRLAQISQIAIQMRVVSITNEQFRSLVDCLPMTDLLKVVSRGKLDDDSEEGEVIG